MRFFFMLCALMVMVMPQAQATENRMTVPEIHDFIKSANSAINNANLNVGRHFLDRTTAANAIFENRVAVASGHPWHQVYYNQYGYSPYYYRYPSNPYYAPTSMRSMTKWDHINWLENKKRSIPGYQASLEVTSTNIEPYGRSAVVDVDLKEYSLTYNPYHPTLTGRVLHANSKCKAYLSKVGPSDLMLTRMDCNTNTTLPY